MDLSDRVSEDVIKIFHNAKGSIFNDVLKWTQALHNTDQEALEVSEGIEAQATVYMAKENRREENPSIFGEQPVSEYSQQPFSPKDNNDNEKPEDKEASLETEIDEQLSEEERSKIEGLKRDKDIEQRRSEYGGFTGNQR